MTASLPAAPDSRSSRSNARVVYRLATIHASTMATVIVQGLKCAPMTKPPTIPSTDLRRALPPRSEGAAGLAAPKLSRRNLVAELLHGLFGHAGQRLFMAPTFLPAFLFALSGSEFVVGMARGIQALGTMLSPALGAAVIGHRVHIKWIGIGSGLFARSQMLVIGVAVLLLPPDVAVVVCLLSLAAKGFGNGFSNVTLNALRARVIPRHRRGIVLGVRNTLGGLVAAALAAWAGASFLANGDASTASAYAEIFILAFAISSLGLLGLAITREPAEAEVLPRRSLGETIGDGLSLLRADRHFASFFLAYGLGTVSRMGVPFYVLHASARLEEQGGAMTGALLGALTTLWLLADTSTRLIWGSLGDRLGHALVMICGIGLWILAQLLLFVATGPGEMMLFFVLVGIASGGFNMGANSLVIELGAPAETALRFATVSTFAHLVATLAPVVGGIISAFAGFPSVFILCMAAQTVALALLIAFARRSSSHPVNAHLILSDPETP